MTNRISASQFRDILRSGQPCAVLDVRTLPEHKAEHLDFPCAHMPLDALDAARVKAHFPDSSKPLYLLCKGGVRAAKAAETLQRAGLNNTVVIDGGLDACAACGVETARGAEMPLERQVRMAAGALVLTGIGLGAFFHPAFYSLSALIGAGLFFSGLSGWCGMALLLAKAPWNK